MQNCNNGMYHFTTTSVLILDILPRLVYLLPKSTHALSEAITPFCDITVDQPMGSGKVEHLVRFTVGILEPGEI